MNQQPTKTVRLTVTLLCLFGLQAYILVSALDCCGWFEAPQVVVFVVLPALFSFVVAWAAGRSCPAPAWHQAIATFVALLLLWQFPVTERPRFVAAANRVRVGMTVTDAWTRLHPYVMTRNNTLPCATFDAEEVAAVAKGIDPHFSGTLTVKLSVGSYSYQEFMVKNGVVTGSRRSFTFD